MLQGFMCSSGEVCSIFMFSEHNLPVVYILHLTFPKIHIL
jgi:hypothetical protein